MRATYPPAGRSTAEHVPPPAYRLSGRRHPGPRPSSCPIHPLECVGHPDLRKRTRTHGGVTPALLSSLGGGLSPDSPLDSVHGNHEPVLARLAERSDTSIPATSRASSRVIAPLGSARATRVKAWRNWRTCLTWALARDALGQILPMPTSTLRAMLGDFVTMGATNATLKSIVDAVTVCHRDAQLPSPVSGDLVYSRLTGCLARVLGTQRSHKMGVTRDMFVHLLRACSWIWPAPAYALGVLRRLGLGHAAPSASPLFPKLSRQMDGSWALHWSPTPSSGAIYAMVVAALSSLGVDTTAFPASPAVWGA